MDGPIKILKKTDRAERVITGWNGLNQITNALLYQPSYRGVAKRRPTNSRQVLTQVAHYYIRTSPPSCREVGKPIVFTPAGINLGNHKGDRRS